MSSTDAPDPKVGLLLNDRYLIVRKLGEGGMGAVYEAKHQLTGRRLAIKCLHPQFQSNREVVERFHREAQAATAVGNEHIIEVTDMGTFEDKSPFIVLEYLDGFEFAKVLEEHPAMPIGRVVHIITQVCDALRNAHAKEIVHRDLKPENIYLIKRGNDADFVKVLDFGISKMKENAEEIGSGLTKTGMALGTPYYMAPEQAQGLRDVDHRTDIYAIGVILFQALTGRLPFDADSYPLLMVKILTEPVVPLRTYREDIPAELDQVVTRAMAKDRNQRFSTVDELSAALLPFAGLQQTAVLVSNPVQPATQGTTPLAWAQTAPTQVAAETVIVPKSKTPLYAGIAGGLVAATLGIALMSKSPSQPPPTDAPEADEPALAAVAAPPTPTPAPPVAPQPIVDQVAELVRNARPSEVTLKISATPSDAQIFIGDVEFPNPMDAFRPRSLDPVRITVKKDGYKTIEQLAIFDQDRDLTFELERGRGIKRLKAIGGESAPTPAPGAITKAAPEPTPSVPTPAPPPTPPVAAPPAPDDGVYRGPTKRIKEF